MSTDKVAAASFRPLLFRALVLPLVLGAAFAGILLWQITRLISAGSWVEHTDVVLSEANKLRALHADMQTGVRGYLITVDPRFRSPFDNALPQIEPEYDKLLALVSDNNPQKARLVEMRGLKQQWLAYVTQEMADRTNNGPWEKEVAAGTGKAFMDKIRAGFIDFIAAEESLRDIRSHTARETAIISLWLTGGMALFLGVAIALLSRQQLLFLSKTYEAALAVANESAEILEHRIEERTAELADANAQLKVSNRELQDFASVASHDLQEPLRKVQAFGDRLTTKYRDVLGEEGGDYLNRMQNAAERMKVLINDLLTFARVTSRAKPFGRVDMQSIAEQVISDLEARIEQTGAKLNVGKLPVIDADATQMRQMMQNFIGNALKFSKPGQAPQVDITSELTGDEKKQFVRFTVRDNGIGFDEKYADRIFAVFQRLHGRSEYEGTGIGLAVCRKIVERHRGTITVHSKPGEGASFFITLPMTQLDSTMEENVPTSSAA